MTFFHRLPVPPIPQSLSPEVVVGFLDSNTPISLKQLLIEPLLNRMFASAIADGDFEELAGRTIGLKVRELELTVCLGYWMGRLRVVEKVEPEVSISGDCAAFRELAEGRTDPDTLFFLRRLSVRGDTELGLAVKNLIEGVEWGMPLSLHLAR